jgi:ABC-type lipoprotein export system ATPase subunit
MGSWAGGTNANKTRARELMKQFGIDHREKSNVKILSGGEKQRVAICRALISDPDILFCDEPTGALDSSNEKQVIDILKQISDSGKTIIMVTHSKEFTPLANKTIFLKDGLIVEQEIFDNHIPILESQPESVPTNPDEPLQLHNMVTEKSKFSPNQVNL